MTPKQHKSLRPGDLIRHKSGNESYVVTANDGTRVTAVRTVDVTNPAEWDRCQDIPLFLGETVEKKDAACALLSQWLTEEESDDGLTEKELLEALDEDRLSYRKFSD